MICTTEAPRSLRRRASLSVCKIAYLNPDAQPTRKSVSVRSSRAVLPEPGAERILITRSLWA